MSESGTICFLLGVIIALLIEMLRLLMEIFMDMRGKKNETD